MRCLVQRVREATVRVEGQDVGSIGAGILVFAGVEAGDGSPQVARMAERLLGYRLFSDAEGKMNLSVRDTGGGVLLVSQFTLAADTRRGTRASFSSAAPPERAEALFNDLVAAVSQQHQPVATGRFRADMQVALVNDGPVTFLLET